MYSFFKLHALKGGGHIYLHLPSPSIRQYTYHLSPTRVGITTCFLLTSLTLYFFYLCKIPQRKCHIFLVQVFLLSCPTFFDDFYTPAAFSRLHIHHPQIGVHPLFPLLHFSADSIFSAVYGLYGLYCQKMIILKEYR